MDTRGRSRTPSRLGSGSQRGEQLFAQKIEQKLQKHNALLEARLQLQRLNSEGIPQLQNAQHSHGSNTPGAASDTPSSEKQVSGALERRVRRPESAGRVSGGGSRPRSAGGSRSDGAISSQPTGGKSARETPRGARAQGKSARGESPGERERISVYTGQIKSGGSVAGMYDPKYTSQSVIKSTNGHRFLQSPKRNNVRTSEREKRGSDSGRKEGEGEEHPSWLFADGGPPRRSSDRSRGSGSGDASERLVSQLKLTAGNKGGEAAEARVSEYERRVSVAGLGHRGSSAVNGIHELRRTSDAKRGKPIRTLRAQGSLEDLPAAAPSAPDSGRSRGPSAREEIEVLRERIASGTATPSGRPAGSSLPDEVAQKEQEHYQQLYQPTGHSLAQRRRQAGGALGFADGWSEEAPARLGRSSSKLEELLMRVEKEGLQASDDPHSDVQRKSRVTEAERLTLEGLQGLQGLDSPQGGFMGERRSQPYEEAPRFRAQQTLSPERPSSFLSIAGGGGLTSLLNGGFLSEGLGVLDARSSTDGTGFGSGELATRGSAGRADSLEGAFPKAAEGDGRELSKSKVGREDQTAETGVTDRAASTSQDSSRPSSARSTSNSVTNPANAQMNPHRPSSATASRDSHVSLTERPASASNVSRGKSGSAGVEGPMRRSHVALSGQGRASTDGQKRLERSASAKSLAGTLSRSGSKSGIFRIASPLQREFSAEDGLGSTGQSSSVESGLGKGLDAGLDNGTSEDFETPTLAQERARLAGANPRADRPPAYVPTKGLERARSVSPAGRRRIEDRFEEETKERLWRWQKRAQEQLEEREKQELAECTFAPVISNKSKELFNSSSRIDFLERIRSWKSRRDARVREEKEKRARRELKECTFQPAVTRYESPLRERPAPSEPGSLARGGFWRSEWDGLPARAPDWEGSLRDGASFYAMEQQKQGAFQTTRDRSTSAPPLRPWSALARPEPRNLGVRFDYGLSRLGFEPDRSASALSTSRGLGFNPDGRSSRVSGFRPESRQDSMARPGDSVFRDRVGAAVNSEVKEKPHGEISGLETHDFDVADAYSTASQRASTEWEARHYERMMSARRHSMDLRRLLNQFNGSSWRYNLTRPKEPNLSDKAHVKVKALERPISPSGQLYR